MDEAKQDASKERGGLAVQLQQCPVGIAVAELLLALEGQVALEGADGLGVVPLEAVDDVGDVVGPLGRVLGVGQAHFVVRSRIGNFGRLVERRAREAAKGQGKEAGVCDGGARYDGGGSLAVIFWVGRLDHTRYFARVWCWVLKFRIQISVGDT